MKILDPVLVPDVSLWCDHINPKEFEDGGCNSIVVGLYPVFDDHGKKVLSPTSRQQCLDVVSKSSMVLQAYYWDDIILDPIQQADWLMETIQKEGFPIKWVWADQEQWWTDWDAWQKAKSGKIPWSSVPAAAPANISSHFENFNRELHNKFPQSGVYTNKGYVSSWAPGMDKWLPGYHAWVAQYGRQPKEAVQMTWAQLKEGWLPDYNIILSTGQKPELVMGHQFTGDVCLLPGSYNHYNGILTLDVSVFSKAFIDAIAADTPLPVPSSGSSVPTSGQTGPADYVVINTAINVRAGPSSGSTWVRFAVKDEVLHVLKIENDWAQLLDNTYVFAEYLGMKAASIPGMNPPPQTPVQPQPAAVDYKVNYARINVRAQASADSAWVGFAVKGEVLHVVKIENGWAKMLNGNYVSADFISKIGV